MRCLEMLSNNKEYKGYPNVTFYFPWDKRDTQYIRKVGQNLNTLMPEFKAGHLLKLP